MGGANKIWTTLQEDVDRMQYIIDVLQTSDGYGGTQNQSRNGLKSS